MQRFLVGLDVGSTTVKTVVRSTPAGEIVFHDYRRHEGQQASTVLHMLQQAKREFVARHPSLISVELSNFKCGHDAFISRAIERIIAASGKPHFSFRDLDENRPLASIRIRVETMHYFLGHYQEQLRQQIPIVPPPTQLKSQRGLTVLPDIRNWQFPPEWPPAGVDAGRSTPENGVQL